MLCLEAKRKGMIITMKKISVYRDFDIKLAQNGKYFASSVELNAFLGFAKAFADISEVKDAIDEFWRKK